ncbi:YggS family pyridoxal phosphate-dependent enzyme [Deltaproteobacteria bacterium TL4]
MLAPQIQKNLEQIHFQIAELAQSAGRKPETVKLIAVSKTYPVDAIESAFETGQCSFGENRIQEALSKIEHFSSHPSMEWHLIGHLQKNKARFCPGTFAWIHSVDSFELAHKLEQRCAQLEKPLQALIQVNLSHEDSKNGIWNWDDVCRLGEKLCEFQWLKWRGLMTMAEPNIGEKQTRQTFADLRQGLERLQSQMGLETLTELSMGMSADYSWAVQEGSTMIRLGRAIFGDRN